MTLHCEGDGRRTVVFTRPRMCENSNRGYAASIRGAPHRRALGLLGHMLNWAVGREYLDRTPFRRGTEVLIRMELEDNKRRRRISESEEAALLAVASPHLRSMIIAALDTGMRRGEMLALRFGDIDWIQPPASVVARSYRKCRCANATPDPDFK